MASSVFLLSCQAVAANGGSYSLQSFSGLKSSQLRRPSGNFAGSGGLRVHERQQCRLRRDLSIKAVAESREETVEDKPEFKLKIDYEEESTTPAPDKSKWTGYVMKDTAGQENIYSVEPTVYVADSMLSTNTKGNSGNSTSTLAFVGTVVLFTLLAAGSAFNISQYKADEVAAGNLEEYSGPPLSYYLEKFSEAPKSSPPAAEEQQPNDSAAAGATLEVVPFVLDQEVAPSDLLSVGYFKQFRSSFTPLAVSFTSGALEAPALAADLPTSAVPSQEERVAVEEAVTEVTRAEGVPGEPILIAESLPSEVELVAGAPSAEAVVAEKPAAASSEENGEAAAALTESGEARVVLAGPAEGVAEEPSPAPAVEFEYNEAELPPELPAEDLASFVEVSDDGGEMSVQNPLQTTIIEE